ncbi:MAG: carboxypeptidase regulatory-like domain-containing protein [Lentimicrobiaceae bacterium]|nr:carboxypeptidase regulatory-like domain-containing protein [Lentimicrobiaceae bacterium]
MKKNLIIIIALIQLLITGCKKDESTPKEYKYSKYLSKIENNSLKNISKFDSAGIIQFNKATNDLKSLKAGDIIVSGPCTMAPYGFLKKIGSVNVVGNTVTLITSNSTLEEVFDKASIDFSKTLTLSDLAGEPKLLKGAKFIKNKSTTGFYLAIDDVVVYDDDGNTETDDDQIKLNGSIDINPSFQFVMQINNNHLEMLRFLNTTEQIIEIEASCGKDLFDIEKEVALATFNFQPITIFIGWVPVVLCPVLEIDVGGKANVSIEVSTNITQNATLEAGLEYNNGSWTKISNFQKTFQVDPPHVTLTADFKAYAGPQFNLLLYGLAGPYVDASIYGELEADIYSNPWWTLYGGAEIGVGVQVQFLGRQIVDYYYPAVIGYKDVILQASGESEGQISGIIKDAITGNPLNNVKIEAKKNNLYQAETYSNSNGEFNLTVPVYDNYVLNFSLNGYMPVSYHNIAVAVNSTTHLEPVMQIDNNYSGIGNISGTIYNAFTGFTIENITLKVRKNINNQTGEVLQTTTTDYYGNYYFNNLKAGNYTIESSGTGYVTSYFSAISIGGQNTGNQNGTITPQINPDEYRFILTWGEYPSDLDSHLTGPTNESYRFHTYYQNLEFWYNNELYASLDIDDISSFGPETTTIYNLQNGMYRFSVHDYSNRGSTYSLSMSNSNAQVRIYKGSDLVQTFYVPTNTEGTLWTVFEIYNNNIVPINTMTYASDPSGITKQANTDANIIVNLPQK